MTDQQEKGRPIRLPEDRLGKLLFGGALADHGEVQEGRELLPDSLRADVLFQPHGALPPDLPGAGLLARLVGSRLAVIENFAAAPDATELRSAVAKLQLALLLASKKREAQGPHPRGCLIVVTPESAGGAERVILGPKPATVEEGVRRWQVLDPIYVVRADKVAPSPLPSTSPPSASSSPDSRPSAARPSPTG